MADRFCAHGKALSDDCFECDMEAHARDAEAANRVKDAPEKGSREDIHPYRNDLYPEKECSVCLIKFRGPFQTCSSSCKRDKYG